MAKVKNGFTVSPSRAHPLICFTKTLPPLPNKFNRNLLILNSLEQKYNKYRGKKKRIVRKIRKHFKRQE